MRHPKNEGLVDRRFKSGDPPPPTPAQVAGAALPDDWEARVEAIAQRVVDRAMGQSRER